MEPVQRKNSGEAPVFIGRDDLELSRAEGSPPRADPPWPQEWAGFLVLRKAFPFGNE